MYAIEDNISVGHDFFILVVREDENLLLEEMIREDPLNEGLHANTGLEVWMDALAARPYSVPSPLVIDPSWKETLDSIPDTFEGKLESLDD